MPTQSVIHIGANKTGSTTLQKHLFSKSNDLIYLGEYTQNFNRYVEILQSLVSDDDMYFDAASTDRLFRNFLNISDTKTFLYSNEDIMTSRVPSLCASRLAKLLPNAKILVVIRNQLSAIESFYTNHGAYLKNVPRRFWKMHVSFDDWMEYCSEFMKYSPLDSFFYYKILQLYRKFYPKNNIHILFYEDFLTQKHIFIKQLCEILDIDSSKAEKLLSQKHSRKRNTKRLFYFHQIRNGIFIRAFLKKPFYDPHKLSWPFVPFLTKGPSANGFLSPKWRNIIVNLYREDNRNLMATYDVALEKYGYPI